MLSSHKFVYPFDVPNGVKILVAGCDVQDDRIEVEVLGIGDDLETWSIEYKRFVGDTEQSFVWDQLDNFLLKSWKHECGMDMYILGAAVDSGHRAKVVYDFCKKREYRRIFPVKGMSGWGKGLVNRAKAKNKEGAWLHLVYVDEMKSKVYSLLKLDTPGAGYCHFPDKPDYDETYFMMLTAERLERKRVNGQWKLHWALIKNRRNEALDCRNYALAIAYVLYPDIEAINKMPAPLSPNSITTIAKKAVRKVLSRGIQ
jgi:phage terminase large subunit GpA-like protein